MAKKITHYRRTMISGTYRSFIMGTGIVLALFTALMLYGAYSSGQLFLALKPLSVFGAASAALLFYGSKIPKKERLDQK